MKYIIYQYLEASNRWIEVGGSYTLYFANSILSEMKKRFPDTDFKLKCEIV